VSQAGLGVGFLGPKPYSCLACFQIIAAAHLWTLGHTASMRAALTIYPSLLVRPPPTPTPTPTHPTPTPPHPTPCCLCVLVISVTTLTNYVIFWVNGFVMEPSINIPQLSKNSTLVMWESALWASPTDITSGRATTSADNTRLLAPWNSFSSCILSSLACFNLCTPSPTQGHGKTLSMACSTAPFIPQCRFHAA